MWWARVIVVLEYLIKGLGPPVVWAGAFLMGAVSFAPDCEPMMTMLIWLVAAPLLVGAAMVARRGILGGANTELIQFTPMRRSHAYGRNVADHWPAHLTHWVVCPLAVVVLWWKLPEPEEGMILPSLHALLNGLFFVHLSSLVLCCERMTRQRRWTFLVFPVRHPFRNDLLWIPVILLVIAGTFTQVLGLPVLTRTFGLMEDALLALANAGVPGQRAAHLLSPLVIIWMDAKGLVSPLTHWGITGFQLVMAGICVHGIRHAMAQPTVDREHEPNGDWQEGPGHDIRLFEGPAGEPITWERDSEGDGSYHEDGLYGERALSREVSREVRRRICRSLPILDRWLPRPGRGHLLCAVAVAAVAFVLRFLANADHPLRISVIVMLFLVPLSTSPIFTLPRCLPESCTLPLRWTSLFAEIVRTRCRHILAGNLVLAISISAVISGGPRLALLLFIEMGLIWPGALLMVFLMCCGVSAKWWLEYPFAALCFLGGVILFYLPVIHLQSLADSAGAPLGVRHVLGLVLPVPFFFLAMVVGWRRLRKVGDTVLGNPGSEWRERKPCRGRG